MTRPASYAKRVEHSMLDLLGISRGRRIDITPSPKDPLPVGVAALHQAVRRKANQAWPAPLTLLHP